jgi:hypothetical protein
VLLALHADVLVHRHRHGSLRVLPDGSQMGQELLVGAFDGAAA